MKIELNMSNFGTHGCSGVAVWEDGQIRFEGYCPSCGADEIGPKFQWTGAAIAALEGIAATPADENLIEYHEALVS